jgi:O-antigen/teichoic acid export membrane protein
MFTRDFLYLAVSALSVILTALTTPILTRRVSADQFGQLALCAAMMQILGPILSFGLPFATQKVFAGEDGHRRARGVLAISAVFAIAGFVVVALAAPLWGPAIGLNTVLDARLAALWGALFALTWTSLAMLRSRERLGMAIFVAALQSLGAQGLGLGLLFVRTPNITTYLYGVIIGQAAAGFVGLLALRPAWSALVRIRRYSRAFGFGLPMVPQQLSGFILFAGDRIVVRHDLGSVATGRYSVAYNVGCLGVTLLVFVNQAWMPRIYALQDRGARARLLASSRDMIYLLLIPVVCGLAAGAPIVLRVWAPPSFHPAKLTLIVAIVAIYAFPYGQFSSNLRALMSEGKTGRAAVTTLFAAAVNIGLNIAMVPYLGITGSAIATVVSYLLLARLTRLPRNSELQVPGISPLLGFLVTLACAVTLSMAVVPSSHMWLDIRLVVSVAAVATLAFLMRRAVSGFDPSSRLMSQVAGAHRRRSGPVVAEPDPMPVPSHRDYERHYEYDLALAEADDATLVDAMPPVVWPIRTGGPYYADADWPYVDEPQVTGPRRARSIVLAVILVLATLTAVGIFILHPGLNSGTGAAPTPTVTSGLLGHQRAGASASAHPGASASSHPTPLTAQASDVLDPVSASAFGPKGAGTGDNPKSADKVIDTSSATAWTTDWYRTAQFGGLQAGTGLLIDMGHRVRITKVRIVLGSERGADLQLLTGNVPVMAQQQVQATASDAGGVLQLSLTKPGLSRYLLIWFTALPPAAPGTFQPAPGLFQASVYNVTIYGRP